MEGLAETNPLKAICSYPGADKDWDFDRFFATGEIEISRILEYFVDKGWTVSNGVALDFGCGVGRLTRALSKRFGKTYGIDISPTMIAKAKDLNREYLSKIDFISNINSDLKQFQSEFFDFVYSVIVIQHIPPPQSEQYVKELLRTLKPGGWAVIQLPVEDLRTISVWHHLRSRLKVRERLALLGFGKGYHFQMYVFAEDKVEDIVAACGANIMGSVITNHTEPTYPNELKFIQRDECHHFVSKLFFIQK